jgi:hypothetical protein
VFLLYIRVLLCVIHLSILHKKHFSATWFQHLSSSYINWNFHKFKSNMFLLRCGTEAVIGYWDNVLLVIGRQGDYINYGYDSAVRLVPEMDGVRVLSAFNHEMIQKVPLVVQQIFRINSTDPSSYLLEASKQFQVCSFFLKLIYYTFLKTLFI